MKATIACGLFLCTVGMALATADLEESTSSSGASDINYSSHGADWTETCATGSSQSPIDLAGAIITDGFDTDYGNLGIDYQPTCTYTVLDEGSEYQLLGSFGTLAALDFDATNLYVYESALFRFHAPSEHQIDGQRYPLEMQIVHNLSSKTPGNPLTTAVLSVLFKEGAHNPTLGTYINAEESHISLAELFGSSQGIYDYYMYKGSLTTPPCTETVNWYVYGEVLEASAEQIAFFSGRWENNPNFASGNNRDVQPLNGRSIYHFYSPEDVQSFLQ